MRDLILKEIQRLRAQLKLKDTELKVMKREIKELRKEIDDIHNSISYKAGRWIAESKIGGPLKRLLRKYVFKLS